MLKTRFSLCVTVLCILFLLAVVAPLMPLSAQGGPTPTLRPVSDDEVNRIAKGLYCPICQNVPLEVCETAACARWREQVRDLIAQGYNESQIRQYFIEHFGPQTVGTPTNPVAQFLTVVLPFLLIGAMGVLIAVNLLMWRRRRWVKASALRYCAGFLPVG